MIINLHHFKQYFYTRKHKRDLPRLPQKVLACLFCTTQFQSKRACMHNDVSLKQYDWIILVRNIDRSCKIIISLLTHYILLVVGFGSVCETTQICLQ